MYGDVEYSGDGRTSTFPPEWGTPPADMRQRAGWITTHIHKAALDKRRGPASAIEAAFELQQKYGLRGDEAMAQLRERYADPSMLKPRISVDDALRQLQRKAARYATMLEMVSESPW